MAPLPRSYCSVETRCRVALAQLGEMWADRVIADHKARRALGALLREKLEKIAELLGCDVANLQRDHDPALVNRKKLVELPDGRRRRVIIPPRGARVIRYYPDENDWRFMVYRPKARHVVKTRVRGDHGQLSDLALARKEKRRLERAVSEQVAKVRHPKVKRKIQGRNFQQQRCRIGPRCACDRGARKRCENYVRSIR